MNKRALTRDDIMPLDAYEKVRAEKKRAVTEMKRNRRVSVGPDVTFYFENRATMWHQVHEMLRIEKGGEEQIADELAAYNPLIPDGETLVATMMIEIEDPERRDRVLRGLGGIENTITMTVNGVTIPADPEGDVERTTPDGKTSSIHFLKFHFSPAQVAQFKEPGRRVILAIGHAGYDHMAALPENVRAALAEDFD